MCKNIQIVYKFCGCPGESYTQTCPNPTATCRLLLRHPTPLPLTCYCEQHATHSFKTIHQAQRETARATKEHDKTLAREARDAQRHQPGAARLLTKPAPPQAAASPPASPSPRDRQATAKAREEEIFLVERGASIRQSKREVAEFRRQEREMEAYGAKWGGWAMRRKYPVARERAEEKRRRDEVEREIVRRGSRVERENRGGRRRRVGCVVM